MKLPRPGRPRVACWDCDPSVAVAGSHSIGTLPPIGGANYVTRDYTDWSRRERSWARARVCRGTVPVIVPGWLSVSTSATV